MKEEKIAVLLDGPVKNDSRVRRVIDSLSKSNEVHLYYPNGSIYDDELFDENVKLFNYEMDNSWLKKNIFFQKKFNHLKKLLVDSNVAYKFIYCNDYPLLAVSVVISNISTDRKLIYDSHEIYIETINQFFPKSGWRSLYGIPLIKINKYYHAKREKRLLQSVNYFVTVCNSLKMYFEKKYEFKDIHVVQNCPELSIIPPKSRLLRTLLKLDSDSFILLYQGNINPGRGIGRLIDASPFLDPRFQIVLLGSGVNVSKHREKCKQLKYNNVHFLDKVPYEELLTYTSSADAGIMLIEAINKSKELALPNKVFEYMAAGIPVISNDLIEPKKIIEKWNCGKCINDNSTASIVDGINSLLDSKESLKNMGENGQLAIKKELNWKSQVETLLDIVHQRINPN